jgi:hypothetical protein
MTDNVRRILNSDLKIFWFVLIQYTHKILLPSGRLVSLGAV